MFNRAYCLISVIFYAFYFYYEHNLIIVGLIVIQVV